MTTVCLQPRRREGRLGVALKAIETPVNFPPSFQWSKSAEYDLRAGLAIGAQGQGYRAGTKRELGRDTGQGIREKREKGTGDWTVAGGELRRC